jgi:hypothetical protein
MRKALTVLGWFFVFSLVLLWGSSLYVSAWNLNDSLHVFINIWNSIRRFFLGFHTLSEIQFFIALTGVGLILLASLILFVKLLNQRKIIVALLSLLMLVYLNFAGLLGFIPFLDNFHLGVVDPSTEGLTFYSYLREIIFNPASEIEGYVFLSFYVLVGLIGLIFIFITLTDIIETPYAIAHVKKMKIVPVPVKDPVETELNKFEVPGVVPTPPTPVKEVVPMVTPPVQVPTANAPVVSPANVSLAEQMRLMIQEELKKNAPKDGDPFKNGPVMVATPWGMQPYTGVLPTQNPVGIYPQQTAQQGITATNHEEVRSIVIQEIDRSVALKKEIAKLVAEELVKLSPPSKDSVYSIINDELVKYDALNREAIDSLIDEKVEKYQHSAIESIKTNNEQVMHALVDARLETLKNSLSQSQEKVIHEEIARIGANLPSSSASPVGQPSLSEAQIKQFILNELNLVQTNQLGVIRSIFAEELKTFIDERKKNNAESKPTISPMNPPVVAQVMQDEEEDLEEADEEALEDEDIEDDDDASEENQSPTNAGSRLPQFVSVVPKDSLVTKTGKKKIIKIPFRERMKTTTFDLKENYDELKNYILSYQVKSRISHSGDTFRLHRKDFIKMTIAGKGLKIYYALNPQDYQNSTFPVGDASRKAMYREMPLFFKVKSSLSVKRAKTLVDDLMKKRNLVQRGMLNIKWSEDYK